MELLEKKNYFIQLFDLYGSILTKNQIEYFKYYFEEDLTLNEIAILNGKTKSASFDAIDKICKYLENYEEKIGMLKYKVKKNELVEKYLETKNEKLLEELKEL
ncbi:MAG: hypothetical protein LBV58_00400 [Acholeplasmatales bacterium]|jgi:predicted DNA-binding protein YlxM (UPF0122 family)|nr:hypothetical protein [Acholeplasmatales bacterium]